MTLLHGPTSANLLITAVFRCVTHIVHTDVGLANLHRGHPITQRESLPGPSGNLAFDNAG
jgi:hypothetical protein